MEFNFEEDSRFEGTITNVRLLPRVGQTQVIEVTLFLDDPTGSDEGEVVFHIEFYDQAFEEFDVYGQPKSKKTVEVRNRQEEY